MPAIQLARLKLQAGHLRDLFSQPQAFVRELRHMLEFYGNHTHRAGQAGTPPPLIPSYNVPAPVLRQVYREVGPSVKENPEQAAALLDLLWQQNNLECRLVAITLLGMLPVDPPDILLARFNEWVRGAEDRLLEPLLNQGLARFRQEAYPRFLKLVENWLSSSDWHDQQTGLRALNATVQEGAFDDLPVLFRLITPLSRTLPPVLRPDMVSLLRSLAQRSPQELAYFMRQNLLFPDTPWLARQVLSELPLGTQESLRAAIKSAPRLP